MNAVHGFMIAAILAGPLLAIVVVRQLDRKHAASDRKLAVFRSLMATRAHTTSWEHVEALSRIDAEFDARISREAAVIDAWKSYVDTSADSGLPASDWSARRTLALVDLLERMAQVVGHDFDREHVEKSASLRMPVMTSGSSR